MHRGATAYESAEADKELEVLADKARAAADRASDTIDEVLVFVEDGNQRIAAMEGEASENIPEDCLMDITDRV